MDATPPDLPERDVNEDLSDASSQSEARRAAERVFARLNVQAHPSEVKDDLAPSGSPTRSLEAPAPRVLPDLLAAAREDEMRQVEKPKRQRTAKASKIKRPRKKPEQRGERLEHVADAKPAPVREVEAQPRFQRRHKEKPLPRGQRWKRRLPSVCWGR
jgi:hypothetical protein